MSQQDRELLDDVRIGRKCIDPFDFDSLDEYLQAAMRLQVAKNQEKVKKRQKVEFTAENLAKTAQKVIKEQKEFLKRMEGT